MWNEKKMYGASTWASCARRSWSAPTGKIEQAWYKISPKDTPTKLLEALAAA